MAPSASKQCTLSTFGLRKKVRTETGRWLREPSPEFVAFGPRCNECGARFKTVQALVSHRRCIHDADWRGRCVPRSSDAEPAAEIPHWAWHFLQGSQGSEPVQVIDGDEATPSPLTPVTPPKRKREDLRRGSNKRQRYTAEEKLQVVEHYAFAKENGLEMEDYLGDISPMNAFKWSKITDGLEQSAGVAWRKKLKVRTDKCFPDMRELKIRLAQQVKDALKAGQRMTTKMVQRGCLQVMAAMEESCPGRVWVNNGALPFRVSGRWIRRFMRRNCSLSYGKPRNRRYLMPERQKEVSSVL